MQQQTELPFGRAKPKPAAAPTGVTDIERKSRTYRAIARALVGRPLLPLFNFKTLLEVPEHSVWVYAAVYRQAAALASIRPRIVERDTDREASGADVDRVRAVLRRVNENQTYCQFAKRVFVHKLLVGEAYIEKGRDRGGRTNRFFALSPETMEVKPDPSGRNLYGGFVQRIGEREVPYPADAIIPIFNPHPRTEYRGLAPSAPARREITTDLSALIMNESVLRNMGRPGLKLQPKEGEFLGDEEFEAMLEEVRMQLDGVDNAGAHLVLPGGIDADEFSVSHKELEMLGGRRFEREAITAPYGAAPMMANNYEAATYANSEQQQKVYWDFTGKPELKEFFDALNEHWVHREISEDIEIVADVSQIDAMIDSLDARTERASRLYMSGMITMNEAREMVGLGSTPQGDSFQLPLASDLVNPEKLGEVVTVSQQDELLVPEPTEPEPEPEPAPDPEPVETETTPSHLAQARDVVAAVAAGEIPRDSGIGLLSMLVSSDEAEAIMGSAGMPDVPTTPNPTESAGDGDEEEEVEEGVPPQFQTGDGDGEPTEDEEDEDDEKGVKLLPVARRFSRFRNGRTKAHATKQEGNAALRTAHRRDIAVQEARFARRVQNALQKQHAALNRRLLDTRDVDQLFNADKAARELFELLQPAALDVMVAGAKRTLQRAGMREKAPRLWIPSPKATIDHDLLVEFGLGNPRIVAFLERRFFEHIRNITETTRAKVAKIVAEGIEAGEGPSEIALRLVVSGVFGEQRAHRVARTETNGVYNMGAQETFLQLGTSHKSWLHSGLPNERPGHVRAERETQARPIKVDERFVLIDSERGTRSELLYPGDPESNAAHEIVNCRCALSPEQDDSLRAVFVESCKAEVGWK